GDEHAGECDDQDGRERDGPDDARVLPGPVAVRPRPAGGTRRRGIRGVAPPGYSWPALLRVGCHDRLPRPATSGRPPFWLLTGQFTGDAAGWHAVPAVPRRAGVIRQRTTYAC